MKETFWNVLCGALPLFKLLFGANVVLVVLLLMMAPFVERGSPAYYVSVMSLVVLVLSLLGSGAVIRHCGKRESAGR
jgi:multisubunit Na+/H+ antiporter MnhE subunit